MEIKLHIPKSAMEEIEVPQDIVHKYSSANCHLYKLSDYGDLLYANGKKLLVIDYIDEDYSWYALIDENYDEIFGWSQYDYE